MKKLLVVFALFIFCDYLAFAGTASTTIDRVSRYVNVPTNSLPLGIELGSIPNEDNWVLSPPNDGLAKIFISWNCDRSPLTKRICSYRLFSKYYGDDELDKIRHKDIESIIGIFQNSGIEMRCRKCWSAQQIEEAFKDRSSKGCTDASLWVEIWEANVRYDKSANNFAHIRLNAINYQKGKGVLSLEVESYDWRQVYSIEQCLMDLDKSKDNAEIQEYYLPRSLLLQTCNPKNHRGWEIFNLEKKVNRRGRVKLTAEEYRGYFNIIDSINEFQRGGGTFSDNDQLRLSEIKKLQSEQSDTEEKLENKIVPKFDEIVVALHSSSGADGKQLARLDGRMSNYKKQVVSGEEIPKQIAVCMLIRAIVSVATSRVEAVNGKMPDNVNDLIADCKSWCMSNDMMTKLCNEERAMSEKLDAAYKGVVVKLKDFEEVLRKADMRVIEKKEKALVPPDAKEAAVLVDFLNLKLPGTNETWSLSITNSASEFFSIKCGYSSGTHKLSSVQVRRKVKAGTRYAEVAKMGRDYCNRISRSLHVPPFVDSGRSGRILRGDRSSEYSYRSKRLNKRYRLLMEADTDFTPRSTNDFDFIIQIYDEAISRESQQITDRYRHIKDLTFCGYRFGEKYTGDLHDRFGRINTSGCTVRLQPPYFGFTNANLRLDQETTNIFEISLSGLNFKVDELEVALNRYDEICRAIEESFKIVLPTSSKDANGGLYTNVRFLGMDFGDYYTYIALRRQGSELSIDLSVRNKRMQEDADDNASLSGMGRNENYTPTENDLRIAKELKAWNATNGVDYTKKSPLDLKLLCGHEFGEPSEFIARERIGCGGSPCKLFEYEFGPFRSMHRLFGAQPGHPMCRCHFGMVPKPVDPSYMEKPGDYQHEAVLLKEKMESLFKIKFEKDVNGNYVYEDYCVKADIRFNVKTTQGAEVQKYPLVVEIRDKRLCAEDSFTQKLSRKYERGNSNRRSKRPFRLYKAKSANTNSTDLFKLNLEDRRARIVERKGPGFMVSSSFAINQSQRADSLFGISFDNSYKDLFPDEVPRIVAEYGDPYDGKNNAGVSERAILKYPIGDIEECALSFTPQTHKFCGANFYADIEAETDDEIDARVKRVMGWVDMGWKGKKLKWNHPQNNFAFTEDGDIQITISVRGKAPIKKGVVFILFHNKAVWSKVLEERKSIGPLNDK